MWASIVKKTTGSALASVEKESEKKRFGGAAIIPKMEDPVADGTSADDYPRYRYLTRPDAPTVEPFFETQNDFYQWYHAYYKMNEEFSEEVHKKLATAWRKKYRWLDVPIMTEMSKEQEALGFFPLLFGVADLACLRLRLKEDPTMQQPIQFGYVVPENSTERRIDFLAFLLKMMHNRSDEICACKTVGEFEKVYFEACMLEDGVAPPSEWNEDNLQSCRKELERKKRTVRQALWALSVKSNLFPGRRVSASEVGVCGVKDLKTLGIDAPIRWFLSSAEMRSIQQFRWKFGTNSRDCDSDSDSDDD